MPNRILHEGLRDSARIAGLSARQFRTFVLLITVCDDFGRFHADPRLVKSACYPFDNMKVKLVEEDIESLHRADLMQVYEVDGVAFLQMSRWRQRTRQKQSKFPPPDRNARAVDRTPLSMAHGDGDGDGDVLRAADIAAQFNSVWKRYPDKKGKAEASKAFEKAVRNGATVEQVADGLTRYIAYVEAKRAGGFAAHPYQNGSTWFNQRGWEDEYEVAAPMKTGSVI